ncbi:putative inhibitor of apoptosis-like protein [Dinothrombium tinctorium]|uniref:Putative inhibitor of apoptosis-like protein n=1 Tax=Dinothrombium tinctorium TaxID=1965070 RepID=A0A3S3S0U2_9ACAR|nr:putative inhibitor of apoptosis-like protein [Dinothrombium tinctorium]
MTAVIDACEMDVKSKRIESFELLGWPISKPTPEEMAEAGLYCVGFHDHVKCPFCHVYFASWAETENPFEVHKRTSPWCRFFTERKPRLAEDIIEYPLKTEKMRNKKLEFKLFKKLLRK